MGCGVISTGQVGILNPTITELELEDFGKGKITELGVYGFL